MPLAIFQGGGGSEGVTIMLIAAIASPILTFIAAIYASRQGWLGNLAQQKTTLTLGLEISRTEQETAVIQELFDRLENAEAAERRCANDLAAERRDREGELAELNSDMSSLWMTIEYILFKNPELEKDVEETKARMDRRRQAQRVKSKLSGEHQVHVTGPPEEKS